jgi:hypothetical protein
VASGHGDVSGGTWSWWWRCSSWVAVKGWSPSTHLLTHDTAKLSRSVSYSLLFSSSTVTTIFWEQLRLVVGVCDKGEMFVAASDQARQGARAGFFTSPSLTHDWSLPTATTPAMTE